jgi:hypothetical protein
MQTRLTAIKTGELLINIKTLVQREKALTLEIIDHLSEISRRRAYLPKHTSLFAFLVDELGYCPSTAQLRLNTLKALQVVPEARTQVLNNKLSLNNLAKTQSFINQENKVLKNQSEAPLSLPEQRELFGVAALAPAHKLEVALQTKKHELEVRKAEAQGLPPPSPKPKPKIITIEAGPELINMIDELKALLSHKYPNGELSDILKVALPLAIREIKITKGLSTRKVTHSNPSTTPKSATASSPSTSTSSMKSQSNNPNKSLQSTKVVTRTIPTSVKRFVWQRDGGRCQFIDPNTKLKCGSQFQLEFDHVRPWSVGGDHSAGNIILCCSQHNKYRWQSLSHTQKD